MTSKHPSNETNLKVTVNLHLNCSQLMWFVVIGQRKAVKQWSSEAVLQRDDVTALPEGKNWHTVGLWQWTLFFNLCCCCDITSLHILTYIFRHSVLNAINTNSNISVKRATRMNTFCCSFFTERPLSDKFKVTSTFTLIIVINIVFCVSCGASLAMPLPANWQALWKQSEKAFGTHQRPVRSQWVYAVSFTDLPVDNTVA